METNDDRWVNERMSALEPGAAWSPDTRAGRARVSAIGRTASRRRMLLGGLAAGGIGAAALFPPARAVARQCVDACVGLFDADPDGAPVGSMAPDLAAEDARGERVRLPDYRGKAVLLNFWATWCPPCRAEMPWFDEFERAWSARGFAVVGVSLDENGWDAVRPVLRAGGFAFRVAVAGDAGARRFGVESLPTTLLIGRDGRVVARWTGVVARSEYEDAITRCLDNGR